jgi:hypothetical protein
MQLIQFEVVDMASSAREVASLGTSFGPDAFVPLQSELKCNNGGWIHLKICLDDDIYVIIGWKVESKGNITENDTNSHFWQGGVQLSTYLIIL